MTVSVTYVCIGSTNPSDLNTLHYATNDNNFHVNMGIHFQRNARRLM